MSKSQVFENIKFSLNDLKTSLKPVSCPYEALIPLEHDFSFSRIDRKISLKSTDFLPFSADFLKCFLAPLLKKNTHLIPLHDRGYTHEAFATIKHALGARPPAPPHLKSQIKFAYFSHFVTSPTALLEDTGRYKTHTTWQNIHATGKTRLRCRKVLGTLVLGQSVRKSEKM